MESETDKYKERCYRKAFRGQHVVTVSMLAYLEGFYLGLVHII